MRVPAVWLHLLLGTLIAATLLVGGVLVYLNFIFYPPGFKGWGEVTSYRTISGWAINRNDSNDRVEVELYIDNQFAGYAVAELPRPDVVQAGWTPDARCGYNFPLPNLTAGEHEARVYALHKVRNGTYITLQMTGNPLRFRVGSDGEATPLK